MKDPDEIIIEAVIDVVEELRETMFIPNPATRYITSTGNLAFNALNYVVKDGAMCVYVDKSIAPYMPYTNEPWLSPYWRGKKNPNEGWWQRFAEELTGRVAARLGGTIK